MTGQLTSFVMVIVMVLPSHLSVTAVEALVTSLVAVQVKVTSLLGVYDAHRTEVWLLVNPNQEWSSNKAVGPQERETSLISVEHRRAITQ